MLKTNLCAHVLLLLMRAAWGARGVAAAVGDEVPGGQLVVLFEVPADGRQLLSPQEADALASQLRIGVGSDSNRTSSSVSECLRERAARGVGLCWATAPCTTLESITLPDDEHSGVNSSRRDCGVLLYWPGDSSLENRRRRDIEKPSTAEVWGYGILSTGIISLSGIGGLIFYPIMSKGYFKEVMNFLIGLAFGSLSATSIFQLIPESFNSMENDEYYLFKTLICWGSIWIFYNVSVLTAIIAGNKKHSHNHHITEKHVNEIPLEHGVTKNGLDPSTYPKTQEEEKSFINRADDPKIVVKTKEYESSSKKTIAAMVIFGDSLHNFVDGMSIGAGYTQSLINGFSISLGVACEEFPHELGDFAVLIKSGFSFKKALKFNYASASTIFLGLVTGILLGQLDASVYIYSFSGGLFLYIALGELVPDLKEMIKEEKANGLKSTIIAYLLQNLGILIGMLALLLVTKYS